ncbi:MAG: hypothetical protein IKK21_08820, partial [Clostridia bacterium]|nr:hypothetical protein [Clostridia bacterium]
MKKRLLTALVLVAALICLCATAFAASDPLKVSMDLSANKFTEPKEITVSITVSNVGEGDMPGAVTLYYPNGKQVEEFGAPVLSVGTSKTWKGTWKVTQTQLDAGRITFKIKYSIYDDNGELINKTKNFSKAVVYTGTVASVEINRTITPTVAKKGQEVSIIYDVVNAGNTDVTDVVITENKGVSSKKGTIDVVPAGGKASYTFTVKMGTKDITSQSTITYTVGGKKHTTKKESAVIKYGEVKLTATVSADKKGGNVGDMVKLTLKLKNSGKTDYTGVKVTDPVLGDVFVGQTVPAGETVTLEKEVPITQTVDYQFTVTGTDGEGMEATTSTGRVTVTAIDPAQAITLSVAAFADRSTVYMIPGSVRFTIQVTNESAVDVTDVSVYAVDTKLYTFPTIAAGETREFVRDVSISMAGQFAFSARVKDQLGETASFMSNVVPIAYAQPTPVPTEAPIVTPPKPVYEEMPTDDGLPAYVATVQTALNWVMWIFGVLAVICLILLLIGAIRRLIAKANYREPEQGQLERVSRRDYHSETSEHHGLAEAVRQQSEEMDDEEPVGRTVGEDRGAPDTDEAYDNEGIADIASGDIMAETLAKLYPERARRAADAEVVIEEDEAP